MSPSLAKSLQQVWRVARLFGLSLLAQLYLLPSQKLTWQLVTSAAIAAGEATYRQVSPQGSARVLSAISKILAFLASAANAGQSPSKAVSASPAPSAAPSPASVSGPSGAASPEVLTAPPAPLSSPAPRLASEAPTGPDGRPVTVLR